MRMYVVIGTSSGGFTILVDSLTGRTIGVRLLYPVYAGQIIKLKVD